MNPAKKNRLEKITIDSAAAKSQNITCQNIQQLKQLFPDVFREDKIDFEALKAVLGEEIDDSQERYNFTWNGKTKARQIAQTPSTGTLRPCKEASVNWDTTDNLFIEGDNLEVLKLLQKSYHKKVKMIYIDPPYNTGKDFVYSDNFFDNIQNYLEVTGQVDNEGRKLTANTETSGRYHSDWLTMIYPRLKLARNLLKDDGVIFVSIDDCEYKNLKCLLDELYGEDNFIASIIWERAYSPVNLKKHFSENHDYLLCYAKNSELAINNGLERGDDANNRYSNPDNDPRGVWKASDLSVGPAVEEKIYEITTPSGRKVMPPKGRCWVLTKERFHEFVAENRIWFGKEGNNVPSVKKFLSEVKNTVTPLTIWKYKEVGHSQEANQSLKKLLDGHAYFDFPKPVGLIERCIALYANDNDIVLDFFAGSGTTAHAVLAHNQKNNKNNRFIIVQLPETTHKKSAAYKAGIYKVSQITRLRLQKAIASINAESGFKSFFLSSTNIRPWDAHFDNLEADNLEAILQASFKSIKEGRTSEDVLYEIFLKYGYELTTSVETKTVNGKTLFVVEAGALIVCLDDEISTETVEGIAKLKIDLNPETTQVVFKDEGFADDKVKTNAIQILKQAGIDDVRSI